MSSTIFALFENNLDASGGVLFNEHQRTLECWHREEVVNFFADLDAARHAGCWVVLSAHYELGAACEASAPARQGLLARALIFERRHALDAAALEGWWQSQLDALTPQMREAGILQLAPQRTEAAYAQQVARILDYIRAGDCYQVNLSFPLTGHTFGHPLALAARLRQTQAVAHGACLFDGERWIISRSPELFFRKTGKHVFCRPMKGTAARQQDAAADEATAERLRNSIKDRAENLMIVDLIRNDLGRLAPPGGVRVTSLFELETYDTVFQLTSSVEARDVDASLAEVFAALFPCGSITGAPKLRAMQIIDELEASARGLYCGALGWIAPEGDATSFNIPIRTLLLERDGACRLDVGSGIVADSNAVDEYAECLTKARFAMREDFQLIETLRCARRNDETQIHLLSWHMKRLLNSAATLHFQCDITAIERDLIAHASSLPEGNHRLRLLLARDGHSQISNAPLDELTGHASIKLSSFRLDAEDLRLRHKTTARGFYDEALQSALQAGHFDTLFLNTRGELCEGARSNLFIASQGKLLTPAVSCGLLPGVLRAQLLAEAKAEEAVLRLDDLQRADRIFMGNALRGLVEVSLAS